MHRQVIAGLTAALVLIAGSLPAAGQSATVEVPLCLVVRAAPDVDLENPVVVQTQIATGAIEVTDVVPCDGAPEPTDAPPAGDTGAWIVGEIETDPMTDEPVANSGLLASSGTSSDGTPIMLGVACTAAGTTRLAIGWHDYLGSDSLVEVQMRIDDGTASSELWSLLDNGEITIYTDPSSFSDDAVDMIMRLTGASRLVVQVRTFANGTTTATFDLAGMENAIANVREACDW